MPLSNRDSGVQVQLADAVTKRMFFGCNGRHLYGEVSSWEKLAVRRNSRVVNVTRITPVNPTNDHTSCFIEYKQNLRPLTSNSVLCAHYCNKNYGFLCPLSEVLRASHLLWETQYWLDAALTTPRLAWFWNFIVLLVGSTEKNQHVQVRMQTTSICQIYTCPHWMEKKALLWTWK